MENLPELSKGWVWTRLGEACLDPQYGWTTSAVTEGILHLLRTTDITSGSIDWNTVPFCKEEPSEKEKYLLKDGDIVISRAGSVGYSHLIKNPKEAIFASYLIRFRPLIDEKYLAFFIKSPSYWNSILEKSLGIAIPNVNASKLKQISIPLPPLPEQNRIVAKIDELFTKLDAGVEVLKKIKTQLKRYRQSVLKSAMEGKLTEKWCRTHKDELEPASVLLEGIREERQKKAKGKYKELPPLDTENLPELPERWAWTTVGEIGEVVTGTTPSKTKQEYYGSDYPFFKPTDLNAGYYVRHSRDGLSKEGLKHARLLPEKCILVTCIGATIGKTGFIRVAGTSNQQINALIPEFKFLLPEFIYFLFISPQINKSIIDNSSSTTLPILNKSGFERLFIPLPPLSEQNKIVEEIERRLSVTDEIEKVVELSLKQAERLRQSILKRAFEGKLVPQDPTDESASVLLERIKEEKERIEAERKTKRKSRKKKTKKYVKKE
jgi:type I restriction enzyme S subunit